MRNQLTSIRITHPISDSTIHVCDISHTLVGHPDHPHAEHPHQRQRREHQPQMELGDRRSGTRPLQRRVEEQRPEGDDHGQHVDQAEDLIAVGDSRLDGKHEAAR